MDLRNILKSPIVYTSYQKLVGGYRARRKFVEDYLNVQPQQKLLDFGCGPGDILEFLPEVNYTGVDLDPLYINKAQQKYGHRATFICSELKDLKLNDAGTYDFVIATGVLHHMSDAECSQFIKWASKMLKSSGRLLTLDGCYIPGQNRFSKFLIDNDRGQHVRTVESYKSLVSAFFSNINSQIEESYFHLPYTLLIMDCSNT